MRWGAESASPVPIRQQAGEVGVAEKDARHRRRGRDATTAAILDAAEELFHERGYEAVTVRDIADQAGVSHALVHQYAGSKEDLFRAVLSRNDGYMVSGRPPTSTCSKARASSCGTGSSRRLATTLASSCEQHSVACPTTRRRGDSRRSSG